MVILHSITFLVLASSLTGLPQNRSKLATELSPRIVGGIDAPEGYAPHMIALLVGDVFVLMMCGGSIISTTHILTAAHCVHGVLTWEFWDAPPKLSRTLRGIIGSNKHTSTENVITFKHYTNHPGWDQMAFINDVGVLSISKPLQLGTKMAVIPLETDWVGGEEECYVTGWGSVGNFEIPDKLQLLYVKTLENQVCVDALYAASLIFGDPPPPLHPHVEICTFHSPGHGMCNGDSGSALVSRKTGKQVGIVAWGYPCAVGAPDVFVPISGVFNFIKPFLDRHYCKQCSPNELSN